MMPRARDKGKAIDRVAMLLPRQFVNYIKDERDNGFLTQEELGLCLDLLIECFLADEPPSNEALRSKYGNQWVRFCLPAVHEMLESKRTYVNQYTPSKSTEVHADEEPCEEVQVHEGTCKEVEVHAEGNIIYNNNKDKDKDKNKSKGKDTPAPDGVTQEVWDEWLAVRRAKRAGKVTPTVLKKLVSEASKAGMTLQQAVEKCVYRGWQGFESEWVLKDKKDQASIAQTTVVSDKQAYVERVRAHMKAGGWVRVSGNGAPLNDPISSGFRAFIRYEDTTGYDPASNTLFWQWYNPMKRWEPDETPVKEARDSKIEPHYVDIWEGEPPCET